MQDTRLTRLDIEVLLVVEDQKGQRVPWYTKVNTDDGGVILGIDRILLDRQKNGVWDEAKHGVKIQRGTLPQVYERLLEGGFVVEERADDLTKFEGVVLDKRGENVLKMWRGGKIGNIPCDEVKPKKLQPAGA